MRQLFQRSKKSPEPNNVPQAPSNIHINDRLLPRRWRPIWLRPLTLIAFTVLFLLLGVALVLIWYFMQKLNGFSVSWSSNHYAWTYGPTAVLVVVVSLWRQVDYCCKINQPWLEMSKGPSPASKTVLLDYMWPMQVNSFVTACKNRHFAIVASICIFALLKVMIVISTTLFIPLDTPFNATALVNVETKFDATNFWKDMSGSPGNVQGTPWANSSSPVFLLDKLDEIAFSGISPDPVSWYNTSLDTSILGSNATSSVNALTNFTLSSGAPGGAYEATANMDVFKPSVNCSPGSITYDLVVYNGFWTNFSLESSDCAANIIPFDLCFNPVSPEASCAADRSVFRIYRMNCTGESTISAVLLDDETSNTYQYAIFVLDYSLQSSSPDPSYPEFSVSNYTLNMTRATAVVCSVSYEIDDLPVTVDVDEGYRVHQIGSQRQSQRRKIANLTDLQMSEAVFSSLFVSSLNSGVSRAVYAGFGGYALSALIGEKLQNTSSLESFFNVELLQTAAQDVLAGLSQQLMRSYFLVADNRTEVGIVTYKQLRLQTRSATLWTILSIFLLVSLVSVIVTRVSKMDCAPKAPALLATNLLVITKSPSLHTVLHGTGALRNSQLRDRIGGLSFETQPVVSLEIKASKTTVDTEAGSSKSSIWQSVKNTFVARKWRKTSANTSSQLSFWSTARKLLPRWMKTKKPTSTKLKVKQKADWMPYSARRHAVCLTLLLPLIAIAVLEILWYLSQHSQEFVTTDSDSSAVAYAVRYASTIVVLIIATLFNSLDFAIATMTAYSSLRVGGATGQNTMLFNVAGDLPPIALLKCVRHRHYGAALSNAASTIGSVLTVIVSGLWVMNNSVLINHPITGTISSSWDIDWTMNNDYNNAGGVFSSIVEGGTHISPLIWQNVVLPEVKDLALQDGSLGKLAGSLNQSSLKYELSVPVIQPYLDCTALSGSGNVTEGPLSLLLPPAADSVAAILQLPEGCTYAVPGGLPSDNARVAIAGLSKQNVTSLYGVARISDLDVGGSSFATNGCPSFGALSGVYGPDFSLDNCSIVAAVCYQRLLEVPVKVNYSGSPQSPTASLIGSPTFDVSDGNVLRDGSNGMNSLSFDFASNFDDFVPSSGAGLHQYFDPFYDQLLFGPYRVPAESILGVNDTANLISAINALYQKYMVHVIDLNFRVSLNSSVQDESRLGRSNLTEKEPNPQNIVTGTVTGTASRLKINKLSKIILECMLGSMFILGALAYWLTDLRGTLPRSPCSLASMMALFADSSLCGDGLDITKDLKGLSLGWWDILPAKIEQNEGENLVTHAEQSGGDEQANVPSARIDVNEDGTIILQVAQSDRDEERSPPPARIEEDEDDSTVMGVTQSDGDREETIPSGIAKVASAQTQVIRRKPAPQKRFGIDIGSPVLSGYSERGAWRSKVAKKSTRRKTVDLEA